MKKLFIVLFLSFLLFSCNQEKKENKNGLNKVECFKLVKDFEIEELNNNKENSWISEVFYSKSKDTCVIEILSNRKSDNGDYYIEYKLYDMLQYNNIALRFFNIGNKNEKIEKLQEEDRIKYENVYNQYKN